jgi:hypothetical protein
MNNKQNILLYIYSTPNIVGAILGICGLIFFFIVLALGVFIWWLVLIVPALYLIGLLIVPRSPQYTLRFHNEATTDEIRAGLNHLTEVIQGNVPEEILTRVNSIKTSILEILPQIMNVNGTDPNIFIIRQTALDYLPEALEYYLNLPPAYANYHHVKGSKTAKQLLLEQLDLLDQQMKEVAEDFHRQDTERLMAHGRFLEQKFSRHDLLAGV